MAAFASSRVAVTASLGLSDCDSMPCIDIDLTLSLRRRNGLGKTTLLRAIARYQVPNFPTHIKVMHVEQEARGSTDSVVATVIKSDLEREYLLKEEQSIREQIDALSGGEGLVDMAGQCSAHMTCN